MESNVFIPYELLFWVVGTGHTFEIIEDNTNVATNQFYDDNEFIKINISRANMADKNLNPLGSRTRGFGFKFCIF